MGPHNARFHLLLLPLLCFYFATVASAGEPCCAVAAVPLVVHVTAELRGSIDDMIRKSPTFRAQYQRLAESRLLSIGVRVDPTLADARIRARSTIWRSATGFMVVAVAVGPGPGRAHWIAHEFEHILEQLDGWDLPALADRRARGVWYSAGKMIETDRAIRAGWIVADEMRHPTESDKLVE